MGRVLGINLVGVLYMAKSHIQPVRECSSAMAWEFVVLSTEKVDGVATELSCLQEE